MKIMVMGTGGVGGYYGGLLAKQGHEVTFIARGAHLKAMRANGLQIKSIFGDFVVAPVRATDTPAEAGPVDFILFCVKTYHTDEAVQAILPAIGAQTIVLSLQNGIDAAERIGKVVGAEHLIGGVTYISSALESPGVVKQISQFRRIVLGEFDGALSPRIQSIQEVLQNTGVAVEVTDDILKFLWTKFVFISATSSLGCLTRLPIGEYRNVPETRALLVKLMQEVETLAKAHGAKLDGDIIQKTLEFIDNSAPHIKPSMQLDVEAGRRTELESMVGVIGRKGREAGLATPIADFVYASLLPIELKAQKSLSPA
jgi:2-dehydropantoate 2-reductase